jgi:hypothetical protein
MVFGYSGKIITYNHPVRGQVILSAPFLWQRVAENSVGRLYWDGECSVWVVQVYGGVAQPSRSLFHAVKFLAFDLTPWRVYWYPAVY